MVMKVKTSDSPGHSHFPLIKYEGQINSLFLFLDEKDEDDGQQERGEGEGQDSQGEGDKEAAGM